MQNKSVYKYLLKCDSQLRTTKLHYYTLSKLFHCALWEFSTTTAKASIKKCPMKLMSEK